MNINKSYPMYHDIYFKKMLSIKESHCYKRFTAENYGVPTLHVCVLESVMMGPKSFRPSDHFKIVTQRPKNSTRKNKNKKERVNADDDLETSRCC